MCLKTNKGKKMNTFRLRLKKGVKNIKKVLGGKMQMTTRQKYHALIGSIMPVHVLLLVVFCVFHVTPMFIFNIFSVLTYAFCFWLMRGEREHYLAIYFIAYIEIILHSFAASICIGWEFGFAQYIIAIVPVGFYICYTLELKRYKFTIATLSAVFSAIAFLSCKFLSFFGDPVVILDNFALELVLYVFNSLCAFTFLILFSLIFIFEIKLSSNQLKHQNAILEKLASTDPLTGLYNRRSMDIFLSQAVETESNFALIMCDIDDFKKVNDTYGHDFGDVVLKGVASITAEQVREQGYVCRWGGEEILILLNNASEENTFRIAENIRRNVSNRLFDLNEKWVHCSLTLGIAFHHTNEAVEETITRADYKLYRGKRSGKNVVIM